MKITIEQEFTDVDAAQDFLARVAGDPVGSRIQVQIADPVALPEGVPTPGGPIKKARKPRSDAGQPRGPYKTPELQEAIAAGGANTSPVPATATPAAAPTTSAAPGEPKSAAE